MNHLRQWLLTPWVYRSLLRDFIRQDISGRFAGSMGGIFWSVVTPLAHILIYVFVFSVIMQVRIPAEETGTDEFVLYLLGGLLPWMAFAEALNRSTTMLLEKASLITKVVFPVEVLPYVGVGVAFILNGLGLLLFLLYLGAKGYLALSWLWLPLIVLLHVLFTLGLFALISSLCVFLRDLQQIVGLLMTIWFYLTPIIYPLSMVPAEFRGGLLFNPAHYFAELYRQALLQHQISLDLLGGVAVLSLLVWAGGGWFFLRIKHAFGDVL